MSEFILRKLRHKQIALFFLLAVSVFAFFTFLQRGNSAVANNYTYVTVHFDGQSKTLATDAQTVGELLERAKIPMAKQDVVQPARQTALISNDYNVNIYRARPVTVVDGDKRYTVVTAAQSSKEIAQAAGLKVYDEDEFITSRIDDFIGEGGLGLKVAIDRATPVNFVLYGTNTSVRTQQTTVADFLREKGVKLQDTDTLSPALATPVVDNMVVDLKRNGTQLVTVEEDVAFAVETIRDADRPLGWREVRQEGKKGRRTVTYEVKLENNRETARKELNSVVTTVPQKQVVVAGAKYDLAEAFAKLRQCEAGGRYDRNSGNGYYGAYQYDLSTWSSYGGYKYPHEAPPDVQDAKALETYKRRGWSPWPACSKKLGLN